MLETNSRKVGAEMLDKDSLEVEVGKLDKDS